MKIGLYCDDEGTGKHCFPLEPTALMSIELKGRGVYMRNGQAIDFQVFNLDSKVKEYMHRNYRLESFDNRLNSNDNSNDYKIIAWQNERNKEKLTIRI